MCESCKGCDAAETGRADGAANMTRRPQRGSAVGAASEPWRRVVFFAIAAVWLDNEGRVVDARIARPWRPYYAPSKPARYLIEARPSLLERVKVGDQLAFDEAAGE